MNSTYRSLEYYWRFRGTQLLLGEMDWSRCRDKRDGMTLVWIMLVYGCDGKLEGLAHNKLIIELSLKNMTKGSI